MLKTKEELMTQTCVLVCHTVLLETLSLRFPRKPLWASLPDSHLVPSGKVGSRYFLPERLRYGLLGAAMRALFSCSEI